VRRGTASTWFIAILIVLLVIVTAVAIYIRLAGTDNGQPTTTPATTPSPAGPTATDPQVDQPPVLDTQGSEPILTPGRPKTAATQTKEPAKEPALDKQPVLEPQTRPALDIGNKLTAEQAQAAYTKGMVLLKSNKFVAARTQLNRAYFSGKLPAKRQAQLRATLADLADVTLIGPRTVVYEGDPYAFYYKPASGESLVKIERKLKLHVPWQLLIRVNGLTPAGNISAGKPYKMIRGPFHAIVYKGSFVMDVYLHRKGSEPVFIKRMRVGIGKDGSTPTGLWRVKLGKKSVRKPWYPPDSSPIKGPIPWNHPKYAFGAKGLWIALEGADPETRVMNGYGIHSTNDPSSVGKASSLGCIRLADADIDLVFILLYEQWSMVEVRP